MIFTERTITIRNESATMNTPVILYRGDKNVEVRFTIIESPFKYSNKDTINVIESTDASYAQLVIKTPNDGDPIFGDITEVGKNTITFVIGSNMIDEIEEVGVYDFQIRLFDENQTSMVTIPEVVGGFIIKEPIAKEDTTNNITNSANVGSAVVTNDAGMPTFVGDKYNKTTWNDGDIISRQKLNKIEDGIYETYELSKNNSSQIKEKASKKDLEVERIRIDSFTSLKEGSTTGDAELIDARIDNEGAMHSNLRNAITFQINNINNNYKNKIFNWKQGTYKDNSNTIQNTNYKAYIDMTKVLLGSKITIKITDTTKYKYRLFMFDKDRKFARQTVDYTDETSWVMNYPYFALVIKQQDGQIFEPSPIINDYIYCEIEKYSDDTYNELENVFYTGNSGGFIENANYNSVYFLAKQGRKYQLYPSVRKICIVENGEYVYYDGEVQNYSFLAEEDFICRLTYAKMNGETQQKNIFQISSYNNRKNINNVIDDKFYSYNLFDKNKSVAGYLGNDTGSVYSNDRYKTSDYIFVYSGASYIISTTISYILFYDASKTPLGSTYTKMDICGYSFNAPANTSYVRFSYLNVFEDYVQLIKNDSKKLLPYLNYDSFGNLNSIYKNENKLSGKTLLTLGDSIMEGNGNSNVGIGEIICSMNQMKHIELSKGGATIGFRSDYDGDDKTHLQKQQNIQYQVDYAIANYNDIDCILINGSTNDIDKKDILGLGDILDGYDTTNAVLTTFSGGLESIFYKLKTAYPRTKIIYIRPHIIGSRGYQSQVNYGERAKDICKKWSVYCVDLFENSGLNTYLDEMIQFTNNNDKCHPIHEGYIKYYIPLIENALTSLF